MKTIDELIEYHEKRKKRADDEGSLGTVSQELIVIDQLEGIKAKKK